MAQFLSGRRTNFNVGIPSVTENTNVLDIIGNVQISGIVTASRIFSSTYGEFTGGNISGTNLVGTALSISGISTLNAISAGGTTGTSQYVLTSTGTGLIWQAAAAITGVTGFNVVEDFTGELKYLGMQTGAGTTQITTISSSQLVYNSTTKNLGIGTTNPTSKLTVQGDGKFTGVVTATTFIGNLTGYASTSGIATVAGYASTAGIATNLAGGAKNYIPYQTGVNTTAFIAYGNPGDILTTDGANGAPYWAPLTIGTVSGQITVRDEGNVVGSATSITQLDFRGANIVATANVGGNIATITVADYVSISGYSTNSGIATYAPNSGIATYATSAGIATYATSSGIATYATSAGISTYAPNSGIATYATSAGIATYATSSGIATYATSSGIATYATSAGISTYAPNSGIATYATSAGIATYSTSSGIATYATNAGVSTNLKDGLAGNIVYQSGPNTTTFLANGSVGNLLQSNGVDNNPTWASPQGLTIGYANTAGISSYATKAGIATNVIGGIASVTSLFVDTAGISTIGIVGISSTGIITSTNPGVSTVTYYGDGSNLKNLPTSIPVDTVAVNAVRVIPFIPTNGVTTSRIGVNSNYISFIPANGGYLGINTNNPQFNLHVFGNGKFVGNVTADNFYGTASYASTAGIATYATSSGIATYSTNAGIATYATNAGIATYATSAGIATYATNAGIATYSTNAGIATYATNAGIATYATSAGIATYATNAGIATYSTNAGIATYATNAGIATYATSAGIATYATSSGIATYSTNAGIATYATNAGIATYATSAGIATYATNAGIATYSTNAGIATYATNAGIATYATSAGIATYATNAGIATYSTNAGIATYATNAGIATYATSAGIATYATNAGIATYSTNAGIATYATNAGIATYATNAGIATNLKGGVVGNIPYQSATDTTVFLTNGGSGTILQSNGVGNAPTWVAAAPASAISGLTIRDEGTVVGGANSISQLNFVGTIVSVASTAGIATITFLDYVSNAGVSTYATNAGIATYATNAGVSTNVIGGIGSITQLQVTGVSTFTNGPVFIGAATSTGTASQPLQVTGGAYVSGNLGIGTTNPTSKLHVVGDVRVTGVVTATTFVGALTGTATSTTNIPNLTGAITSVNTTTSLGSFTSSQLATALTDETGSGANVFATSPTLVTPVLGAASATSIVVSSGSTFTNGPILVGTATSTGTASQRLQVTGGAYVSGSVGIGTTNPTSKLYIVGDTYVTGVVTATSYYGDGSQLSGVVSPASNGEFYTGVSSSLQLTPLSYETSIYTFPATAGKQYVIESINVANVDTSVGVGTTVNIIASIQDSTGEQTYIAYNVPIVNGGLIELLKNPIVAGPSDVIKMWTTNGNYIGVNTAAEVYVNYSEFTSTAYTREYASTVSIASTDITTIYTSSTYPSVIESIHLANRTDTGDYPVSVTITNGLTTTYLAKDLLIPRYATVDILDRPKRIELNGTLGIKVGQTSTIDVIIAGKQIT